MVAEIDIRQLKAAIDSILDHIVDDLRIEKLPISDDRDFYWDVPEDKRHAVKEEAPVLDEVGRLTDDLAFIRSVYQSKNEAFALMLIHAAPLLRYVGDEIRR
jgi:hypothetical protein